jgi:hypothetical protein
MSADAWENCPFCHSKEAVREDYEMYLNENGSVLVYFKAVCRGCGTKWGFRKDINCVVKKGMEK